MANSSNKLPTPTLFISNYYDDLINQIDIYTESLLESIPKSRSPRDVNKSLVDTRVIAHREGQTVDAGEEESWIFCKTLKDPYNDTFSFDESAIGNEINLDVDEDMKTSCEHDGVHSIRMKLIEYTQRLKEANLRWYDDCTDKSQFKIETTGIEDYTRRLIVPKFCFVLNLKSYIKKMFTMCLFELDFYLRASEIKILK